MRTAVAPCAGCQIQLGDIGRACAKIKIFSKL